jgi:hypothetical protein
MQADQFHVESVSSLPASREDVSTALGVAESFLESSDASRIAGQRFAARAIVFVLSAPVCILLAGSLALATGVRLFWSLSSCVFIFVVEAISARRIALMQKDRAGSDVRAAIELIRPIRELLPSISSEENWSYFEYQAMRSRLSRFPV